MQRDIRETSLFRQAQVLHEALRRPGSGQISDAIDLSVAPDGSSVVFAGTISDALDGTLSTHLCKVNLTSGNSTVLTSGLYSDRLPKYSPNGHQLGFLSDRHEKGDYQLYFYDVLSGVCSRAASVEGWVEYFDWSPDGQRILLGVAEYGADLAGTQGATASKQVAEALPAWLPVVDTSKSSAGWRSLWIYDVIEHRAWPLAQSNANVWEAVWCGTDRVAAIVSPAPGEALWYRARLALIDVETACRRDIFRPKDQISCLAGSPSGQHLAVVEAPCSDRGVVAGELRLIEVSTGRVVRIDTHRIDVSHVEWRSERQLLIAGHRRFESVTGLLDVVRENLTEIWSSTNLSAGVPYIRVAGLNASGDCVLVGEGFSRAPEIALITSGRYRCVKSFDLGYSEYARYIATVEPLTWEAPDGLDIEGWLLSPSRATPHPLVMNIHGGPIWHWRQHWLGRSSRSLAMLMLVALGYGILMPNPRGSTGRGVEFASRVVGDMGGADTQDLLSGLRYLVQHRIADSEKLGVTGQSYGGLMTSWLITQDPRLAAAVPIAAVNNHVSQRFTSNIPDFSDMFLADRYDCASGKYFSRSPIMHARRVRTPTLNICGALDRCTPASEAVQFHHALKENGAESVLLIYPKEGHGIRTFPASIDFAARIVGWFRQHMPAVPGS